MKTIVIKESENGALATASRALLAGNVIAFPTDTVYGIGCLVNNAHAIERIYMIKERDKLKAIPVLIGETKQLSEIAIEIPEISGKFADAFWPGALTMIIKKNPRLPGALTTYETVGVRMPDHDWLRKLITTCGPLAVTSANISGQPSLSSGDDVLQALGGKIDLLVDGGKCTGGIPSTVVDCTVTPFIILREGAISAAALQSVTQGRENSQEE